MKKVEKTRITQRVQEVAGQLEVDQAKVRERAERLAAKFSPTSGDRFREMGQLVWWLIALDSPADALRMLDALCEIDDEYYWMFDGLASTFASRAWLRARANESSQSAADAQTAADWLARDPNPKPPTTEEVQRTLQSFQDWLDRADEEEGDIAAADVLAHALRVLVIYQQLANTDCPAAQSVSHEQYAARMDTALEKLRGRIQLWAAD